MSVPPLLEPGDSGPPLPEPGDSGPPLPEPEDIVAGHLIERRVGEGAMGVVYEAMNPDGGRVALKVLRPEKAAAEGAVQEFLNEAKATGAVDHENVVTVLGGGEDGGHHYILMEFVDGPPLNVYLKKKRRLPWQEATRFALQVARALHCAHTKGLVHRDVKPDNILLFMDGRARLTDFGIVKDISSLRGFLLKGKPIGTAAYASPEQCLDKRLDAATDQYSLGATLYHMVCGRYPFRGETANEIMNKHVKAKLIPPSSIAPKAPKPLSNTIEKMMAKKQTDRYSSMARVIQDLEFILEGKVAIANQKPRVDPSALKTLKTSRRMKDELGTKPKVPAEVALVIGLLLVVAAIVIVMLLT